jgi:hypothetical protein
MYWSTAIVFSFAVDLCCVFLVHTAGSEYRRATSDYFRAA